MTPLAALNVFGRCRNEKRRKSPLCCQMVENARTFINFLSGYLTISLEYSHLVIFPQFEHVLELSEWVRRVSGWSYDKVGSMLS